jgi:hypothetical protein
MTIEKTPCEQPDIPECKYSKRAAREAVKETFAILGVDVSDPKQVAEFQQDLRFGRSMRCLANKGLMAAFAAICVAMVAALGVGVASRINGH